MSSNDPRTAMADSTALARRIAKLIDNKKGTDILILEVGQAVGYTDYFVIATGGNERQIKAIHDAIYGELKHGQDDSRILPQRTEGLTQCKWVLIDYLDVVVHIFSQEARGYYRLEKLWGDVPRLPFDFA